MIKFTDLDCQVSVGGGRRGSQTKLKVGRSYESGNYAYKSRRRTLHPRSVRVRFDTSQESYNSASIWHIWLKFGTCARDAELYIHGRCG